jgi:hypothetical protein
MSHNSAPGFFEQLFTGSGSTYEDAKQNSAVYPGQIAQLQNSGMSMQQAQQAANAHFQHMATQAQMAQANFRPARYMIDGRFLDFDEFIDELYPEDCPEKTMLILKLKKEA